MRKYLLLAVCMLCSLGVSAQFSGAGSGTSSDPYQITNAEQLFEVRNSLSAYYKLMNDIDLTEWIAEESPTYGWNPISSFSGSFDGNNMSIKGLTINRGSENYVGLFGTLVGGTISNLTILNPRVSGNSYVGGLLGYASSCSIQNVFVVEGSIEGINYVGGILGGTPTPFSNLNTTYSIIISTCYVSSKIVGNSYTGGIIGKCSSSYASGYYYGGSTLSTKKYVYYYHEVNIHDNLFCGGVFSTSYSGGIVGGMIKATSSSSVATSVANTFGNTKWYRIYNNIVLGNVMSSSYAGGICGHAISGTFTSNGWDDGYYGTENNQNIYQISNNVCISDTIISEATSSYRISDLVKSGYNNYAYLKTVLISNDTIVPSIEDGLCNGTSCGPNTLKRKATYEGFSFNFDTTWKMNTANGYPCLMAQAYSPTITSFLRGNNAFIKGTAAAGSTIYVFVSGKMYSTYTESGSWEILLGKVAAKENAHVYVLQEGMMPSHYTSTASLSDGGDDQNEYVPYAVWCAENQTLYFTNRTTTLKVGSNFSPTNETEVHPITSVWTGTDVTASGSSMPAWWMTVYGNLKKVVFESSFKDVRPTSTSYWFFFCSQLREISGLEYLETINVMNMANMFSNSGMLTTLDLSGFNTTKVTDMQGMFMNCTSLSTIYVSDLWTTSNVTNSTNMFQNCMSVVGGNGTTYDASHIDYTYAHIDVASNPGYLTDVMSNTEILTDGVAYTNDTDVNYGRLRYARTFSSTGWQSLYVPLRLSYEKWASEFDVARLNDVHQWDDDNDGEIDRTTLEVILLTSGTTEPNTPYLIRAKKAGEKSIIPAEPVLYAAAERSYDVSSWYTLFTFTGTYSGIAGADMLANGYYAFGGGSLVQAASAESALKPMRWYISVTDRDGNPKSLGEVKVMVFGEDEGETTTIGGIPPSFSQKENVVFDLSGRQVAKPRKGIYIKNGRKYIVK